MPIKPIVLMGNPNLKVASLPITDFSDPELSQLITDMSDTMADLGAVGIAAPQIGVNKRVIVFGFEQSPRYPDAPPIPHTVLINPEFTVLDKETIRGWEGCLSLPKLRGEVPRYKKIQYWGYDLSGNKIEKTVDGFHARLIQHEVDHLNGTLFIERVDDFNQFGFEGELFPQL